MGRPRLLIDIVSIGRAAAPPVLAPQGGTRRLHSSTTTSTFRSKKKKCGSLSLISRGRTRAMALRIFDISSLANLTPPRTTGGAAGLPRGATVAAPWARPRLTSIYFWRRWRRLSRFHPPHHPPNGCVTASRCYTHVWAALLTGLSPALGGLSGLSYTCSAARAATSRLLLSRAALLSAVAFHLLSRCARRGARCHISFRLVVSLSRLVVSSRCLVSLSRLVVSSCGGSAAAAVSALRASAHALVAYSSLVNRNLPSLVREE